MPFGTNLIHVWSKSDIREFNNYFYKFTNRQLIGDISVDPKVSQISPKWDKYGNPGAPNALESDLKKPRICPIWGQSDPLWSQTYHP